jgi:hypothetical protein
LDIKSNDLARLKFKVQFSGSPAKTRWVVCEENTLAPVFRHQLRAGGENFSLRPRISALN